MKMNKIEEADVYDLITELCKNEAEKYINCSIPQKELIAKMRSCSYEIMLKKSVKEVTVAENQSISKLLSYYYALKTKVKNVAEFKKIKNLNNIITILCNIKNSDDLDCVLRFLISLKDSIQEDLSFEMFEVCIVLG